MTLTFQKVIHFTDWVVGHAHMVMFEVFGFWIFGFFCRAVAACGRSRAGAPGLPTLHYWFTVIGLIVMVIDLTAAGLVQGYSWISLDHWSKSVLASDAVLWVPQRRRSAHHRGPGLLLYALGYGAPPC